LHGQAFAVHDGVDLGAGPPARPPHLLGSVAGDAGSVLVHTDDRRVDHLHGRIMGCGQGGHDLIPDACLAPANEAIVAGGVGSVAPRQIAPRCSGPQHLEDTIEGAPVIHTRDTARPVGEHRLDDAPFAIGEFVSLAGTMPHDLRQSDCRMSASGREADMCEPQDEFAF
jgi:hypothetical protein